jgi:hypothetical protein
MRRLLVLLALVLAIGAPALAGEVAVTDLLIDGGAFDGEVITVQGELVGDFQRRGEWTWVQVNDDPYAEVPVPEGGALAGGNSGIAVRFPTVMFDGAGFEAPGAYGVRGPVVLVTGEWRYHDEDRGGESYLDVIGFEIVERERRFDEEMPLGVLLAGVALLGAGAAVRAGTRRRPKAGGDDT